MRLLRSGEEACAQNATTIRVPHLGLIGVGHEVQVPLEHAVQAGIAAGAEPTQQVERGRALIVRPHQPGQNTNEK